MKRYWLFIVDSKKPKGGMDDLAGNYTDLEEAEEAGMNISNGWSWFASWHIWDSFTLKIIKRDTE